MSHINKQTIKSEVTRLARKTLNKQRKQKERTAVDRELFYKRTGCPPGVSERDTRPPVSDQFDPIYCLKNKKSIAYKLEKMIRNKEYAPQPAARFDIPKSGAEFREIMSFGIPDAAVANLAMRAALARNRKYMSKYSYAYDPEKSLGDAIRDLKDYTADLDGFFALKLDFRKYFDSLPHDLLHDIIHDTAQFDLHPDERFIFERFVRHSYSDRNSYGQRVATRNKGVPQGVSCSMFLANIVCNTLDWHLARSELRPARYADDILVLCPEYAAALDAAKSVGDFCALSGLEINAKKSGIVWVSRTQPSPEPGIIQQDSVEFVGVGFAPGQAVLPKRKIGAIKSLASRLINLNLIRYLEYNVNPQNVSVDPPIDWDLFRLIRELRARFYAGHSEADLSDWVQGRAVPAKPRRMLAYLSEIDDPADLRRIDGWLVNVVSRTMRARNKILSSTYNLACPTPRPDALISGEWMALGQIEWHSIRDPDCRLPSLTRAWRAVRSLRGGAGVRGHLRADY